jgi:hypothetical protein
VIFLILFSHVILCDFFPLYDFKCFVITDEHNDNNIVLKNVKKSISNLTKINLTENEDISKKYAFQQRSRPTTSEIILDVWMFTLFCEEIRQVE